MVKFCHRFWDGKLHLWRSCWRLRNFLQLGFRNVGSVPCLLVCRLLWKRKLKPHHGLGRCRRSCLLLGITSRRQSLALTKKDCFVRGDWFGGSRFFRVFLGALTNDVKAGSNSAEKWQTDDFSDDVSKIHHLTNDWFSPLFKHPKISSTLKGLELKATDLPGKKGQIKAFEASRWRFLFLCSQEVGHQQQRGSVEFASGVWARKPGSLLWQMLHFRFDSCWGRCTCLAIIQEGFGLPWLAQ